MILMIQPAQHQTSRSVGSKNMTKYLFGLTIIELLVTVALIAIMAALSISSLKRIRRPQELVDTATMVIENLLNQANSDSVTTNTTKYICNLSQNIGSNLGRRSDHWSDRVSLPAACISATPLQRIWALAVQISATLCVQAPGGVCRATGASFR